jgi:4-hydroxybenzoate polyprenyltransferase
VTSTNATLTGSCPFAVRLWAYVRERFPPVGNGLLIVSYYSSNQFLANVLTTPGEPVRYTMHSLLGALVILAAFFHLRVFDEHKDFEQDSRHYPERVLQRGLVTLHDLRRLAVIAIGLELALCALRGWPALVALGIALGYSLLMLKEFFAGTWLRRRFLLYTGSHMMIMPLLALVIYSFATGRHPWEAPGWFWVYAFVGFFVTLNWEISRKIRSPEQEIEGVDSYTKSFGLYGAAYLVLAVRVVDTVMVALVGRHLGLGVWFYAALVALFGVCLVGFLQFRLRTGPETAKRMETYAAIYIVAFDVILAAFIAVRYGLRLGS